MAAVLEPAVTADCTTGLPTLDSCTTSIVVVTLSASVNVTVTVPPAVPLPAAPYAHSSRVGELLNTSELTRAGVPLIALPDTELTPMLADDPWR